MPRRKLRPYPDRMYDRPHRPPDWRWQRANELYMTGQYYSKKRDDPETGVAVQYLRERDKSGTEYWESKIRRKFQHVVAAEELANSWDPRRLELECRILAHQSDVQIADALELAPEAVQAYHDLYYDVRPWIDARFYICHHVIDILRSGPAEWRFAKRDAYAIGPVVIPLWMRFVRAQAARTTHRLNESDRRMIAVLIARNELADDDSPVDWYLDHPQILVGGMSGTDFPQSICSQIANWGAQQLEKAPLPSEKLRRCAFAPPPLFDKKPKFVAYGAVQRETG